MERVYNFSAGPAVLPEEVLREAAGEMLNYRGTGMSVMEMSHRSRAFEEIITTAEQDLRDLLKIPENYKVLFLQDSGQKKRRQRRKSMEKSTGLPLRKTGLFPTFQTVRTFR